MEREKQSGDRISGTIRGDVSGQVAIGKDIEQEQTVVGPGVTPEELAELRSILAGVKERVAAEAPPEQRDAALERVDELEQAVTAEKPDLTTMEYVRNWFAKNLPTLAGTVTGVFVNPIVGKLVQSGGDALVAEFQRRFEGD
jgi:hypothetical protein